MSPSNLFEYLFPAERDRSLAILFEHREITYRDLREQTLRLAEILKAEGIEPGDRVALLLADSPEFIAAFVAIISLGAIAIPINLALQSRTIIHRPGLRRACGNRRRADGQNSD